MWTTLRKFGLEYCDLPTMLWNVGFHLRTLTLNIDRRDKPIRATSYLWVSFIYFCYSYVYIFNMLWFVFWFSPKLLAEAPGQKEKSKIILTAMTYFSQGLVSSMSSTKLLFMYFYRDRLQNIVAGCLELDSEVVPNSRFSTHLLRTLRVVKTRAVVLWTVLILDGVLFVASPLFSPPHKRFYAEGFEFFAFRPNFVSPNFEINYTAHSVAAFVSVYVAANSVVLFMIIIGYIEAQLLALSAELEHLWDDAVQHCQPHQLQDIDDDAASSAEQPLDTKALNAYVKSRLDNTVKLHTTYMDLIGQTGFILEKITFTQIILVTIALIGDLAVGLEDTWLDSQFALMFVGVDCFMGQRLMDANKAFENAVYNCQWENFNVPNRKTVLLILQNSQKTMSFAAGGVMMMNFESFMEMIKLIYSAYTTLRARI